MFWEFISSTMWPGLVTWEFFGAYFIGTTYMNIVVLFCKMKIRSGQCLCVSIFLSNSTATIISNVTLYLPFWSNFDSYSISYRFFIIYELSYYPHLPKMSCAYFFIIHAAMLQVVSLNSPIKQVCSINLYGVSFIAKYNGDIAMFRASFVGFQRAWPI